MSPPRSSPKRTIRLLAITDAIPLVWVLAYGARRRRIEPIGVTAAGVFAVALPLTTPPAEARSCWNCTAPSFPAWRGWPA